jgi:nucleoside-diphosphate-sugar epimerase
MRVLIIGCGYVGLPLGAELVRSGHEVHGLRRSGPDELKSAGIQPLMADITKPDSLPRLAAPFDWVVNTAAAGGGPEDYRRVYLEGIRNIIDWLRDTPPKAYVYTGSTSVYAQNDGSIVTEADSAEPDTETGRILKQTEQVLLEAANRRELPAMVLRCAGIYGPGRGYWLQQFLRGEAAIEGNGERWLNMIHREDVGLAIMAALERGQPGSVYNVVDDEPVQQRELFGWLAGRLGKPLPESVPESSVVRRRGVTNKRISNTKLRRELGCKLRYPTFREGYEAELRRLDGMADE